MACIFYGLTGSDVRGLACECALKYNLKIPDNWHDANKFTGKD